MVRRMVISHEVRVYLFRIDFDIFGVTRCIWSPLVYLESIALCRFGCLLYLELVVISSELLGVFSVARSI